jgi:hypothetical protein
VDGDPAADFVEGPRGLDWGVGRVATIAKRVANCRLGNIHTLGTECGHREVEACLCARDCWRSRELR